VETVVRLADCTQTLHDVFCILVGLLRLVDLHLYLWLDDDCFQCGRDVGCANRLVLRQCCLQECVVGFLGFTITKFLGQRLF